jgi:Angiotensin-converting enzyme
VKNCDFHFSDFMQKGASLPAPQLIKLITRGRTSRLSADPLLEFFRPLEAWLEVQNRDEPVSKFCFALFKEAKFFDGK